MAASEFPSGSRGHDCAEILPVRSMCSEQRAARHGDVCGSSLWGRGGCTYVSRGGLTARELNNEAAEVIFRFSTPTDEFGPPYIGVPVSALAYGITCCQAYCYFHTNRAQRDPWFLKAAVALLILATTLQEIFIVHALYHYLVLNFGNRCTLLARVIWSVPADLVLNCPVQMIVGGFLVHRIWMLSHNMLLTILCILVVLTSTAMNFLYSLQFFSSTLVQVFFKLRALGIACFAVFAFTDTSISSTLVYLLYRSRTGFDRSDSILTTLIRLTVSANVLTTLCTLGGLIAYVLGTHSFYVSYFVFVLDKMYLSSMLSTLNLRDALLSKTMIINSIHMSRIEGALESGETIVDTPPLPEPKSPDDLVPLSSRFSHASDV